MPGNLVIAQEQGVTVVTFRDAAILDAAAVETLSGELHDLVDKRALKRVLLDFGRVKFLSSSMIGTLITLHRKSQGIGGKVVVCGLAPQLSNAFKILKLDGMLNFAPDEAQGLRMLAAGS
jgi:anti-anti-sigma factor